MTEQVLRTLMRTTDVIVAGVFSPAAVAAVGLADIYARLPLWFGLGVGDGAIALSSQDTGSGATANRDEAVSTALTLGVLAGIPFAAFGLLFDQVAISVLGAEREVVLIGASYLAIILLSSPARHVTLIAARSIQGTGDTRTPMYVNLAANALNIGLTVGLAFGVAGLPEYGVVGIAIATAVADVLAALTFLLVLASERTPITLVQPSDLVIAKQLVLISAPRIAEGLSEVVAQFPFNAILLAFGTEVNAAYHIGMRLYQQIAAPLSRGYGVAANVLVGQALGRGEAETAYYDGLATTALGAITVGGLGAVLFFQAEAFVSLFTRDPVTIGYAADFARAYAVATVLIAPYAILAGSLRGGSETRSPFVAKVTGTFVFLLGMTYVGGVWLEYGVVAAYVAIVADYLWRDLVLGGVYYRRNWIERGTRMMRERGSLDTAGDE
ncbi:MATE family efflux transporter [Natranaeroarchaeum aerophilus]|uniref:Multidrug-efflux transporter n=1 Tax=Natranaeroarchaeum aerophilus TaxID=2917711 RepID=A0AAE3K2W7_9EURY|nr:MATE family efflux transporter [Natranaeroarchaeum aerophilus]MCL9812068.1 MATE family efflux transporter [Natranaeroarchaeum aerophilus]